MALEGSGVPMTSPPPFVSLFLSKTWYGGGHDNPVSILCLTECNPPLKNPSNAPGTIGDENQN